jgi:hypothetical protein
VLAGWSADEVQQVTDAPLLVPEPPLELSL